MMNPNQMKYRINQALIYASILLLIVLGVFGVRYVLEHNYILELKNESDFIAAYISERFDHYDDIKSFTFELLDEKLEHTAEHIFSYPIDNDRLASYTEEHHVDVLVLRDASGTALFASDPIYLNTTLPVDCALNAIFEDEDMKRLFLIHYLCPLNGEVYYVGMFKHTDGTVLQVGIHESQYNVVLDTLSKQRVMEEIAHSVNVKYARLIDVSTYTYSAHSTPSLIGLVTDDVALIQAIDNEERYFVKHYHSLEDVDVYCVAVPYYIDSVYMGVINIGFDTHTIDNTLLLTTLFVSLLGVLTYVFVVINLSLSNRSRKKVHEAAFIDPITRLENRNAFYEYASFRLSSPKERFTFVMINIQNFKRINDLYGFDLGDELLYLIGLRLNFILSDAKVFRYHNDNFIVCMNKLTDHEVITALDLVILAFHDPFVINDEHIDIGLSIGVHNEISYSDSVDSIIQSTSIAMHEASSSSRASIVFYDDAVQKLVKRRQMILESLRLALKTKDQRIIEAHYQPIYDAKTKKIEGVELLARMNHPKLGMISPLEFIDIAEKEQLILALGEVIQQKACDLYPLIFDHQLYLSLNVSVFELIHDQYVESLVKRMKRHHVDFTHLRIEVTESTFARDYQLLKHRLKQLSNLGFKIAFDDFGTGYSSLSYLQEVNFDTIKIDQSFVSQITHENRTSALVQGIIEIAHKMRARVTAEGVETLAQLEVMVALSCDSIQGYYLSKPLTKRDFLDLLNEK